MQMLADDQSGGAVKVGPLMCCCLYVWVPCVAATGNTLSLAHRKTAYIRLAGVPLYVNVQHLVYLILESIGQSEERDAKH